MQFGIFYEHQFPRPWDDDAEHRLLKQALEQVELAERLAPAIQRALGQIPPLSPALEIPPLHSYPVLARLAGEAEPDTAAGDDMVSAISGRPG